MLLVDSTVSAGHLASACPGGAWQPQNRNPNFPTRLEHLHFCWLGHGRSSFQPTLFEQLDRASRGWGWSLSSGSAASPAPLMRQVQGWVWSQLADTAPPCCKGSSPRAEQVFGRRLCWDFLRAQAMRAWVRSIRVVAWLCRRGAVFTFSRSASFEGAAKSAVQFCSIPGQFNLVCETSKDTANHTITN